ncbi:Sedoheptulose 1,7-bisphosphatase [Yamadazyma tenuis]|uniref:Phosphoglycerate mutase-like protein n=1 Tax=Candida tenuis (strain ATCC 10573 / BCRC 21748 / CBS 615 / JCM 9827 / NBRC 10315 / NRRL Y-1498 / VKM Y-70) TaxID=590646 RepID=G3BD65_CANTC|nr:phosphoglycerate mutase-like protein [Yamadazyma tenuis ATCC 10573]XP_006689464.1 uncharacterized protein CANTEDRAFT_116311 [Yamadazyma tenuis ATCC 10573]EGV60249.1 phosphoglycerate mutase-like protein [Yamadazyma tenuis ATCC 10573]EGV60250.1 hypothetical protein CANTEDRAFT_116311 [Yamadazyma tenuis ATCC 10573]WEJ94508.1 Sedoheptulose 1,7-bisphosphatase [Yamadazyma tenuis]
MTKAPTPRVIFVRHGQTEWSKSGQYTSITDLELTDFGVRQMKSTGKYLIGASGYQLINPSDLKYVITSPRRRAQHTVQLLLEGLDNFTRSQIPIEVENDLREWEYGDYEGLLTKQIKELRASRGLGDDWDFWRDGCENGEIHTQVKERLDSVIARIRAVQGKAIDNNEACDIVVVGHGHILRCFAARWVGREINVNPQFMLDAGGVGVLSYQHHNIEEPALFLAGAFVVPVEEQGEDL